MIQLIRQKSDNLIMYVGNDLLSIGDKAVLGEGWCDQRVTFALAEAVDYAGELPDGFIPDCWTYDDVDWVVVPGKDAEVAVQTRQAYTLSVPLPTGFSMAAKVIYVGPNLDIDLVARLTWDDMGSSFSQYIVGYKLDGTTDWIYLPITDELFTEIPNLSIAQYHFRVKCVSIEGIVGGNTEIGPLLVTASPNAPANITGLALDSYGSGGEFYTDSPRVVWNASTNNWHDYYEVAVYTVGDVLVNTFKAYSEEFTYTLAQNTEDASGSPIRSLKIKVKDVLIDGTKSLVYTSISIANVQEAALANVATSVFPGGFEITYDSPTSADWAGVTLVVDTIGTFSVGLTNNFKVFCDVGSYDLSIGAYDRFGQDGMNNATPSVTVLDPSTVTVPNVTDETYHWPLDDIDGNEIIASKTAIYHANTGNTPSNEGRFGKSINAVTSENCGAILLDATDADDYNINDGDWAIELGIKPDISVATQQRVLSRDWSDKWAILWSADTKILKFGKSVSPLSNTSLLPEEWAHIVIGFSISKSKMYWIINGVYEEQNGTTPTVSDRPLVLGTNTEDVPSYGNSNFVGLTTFVKTYSRSVTEAEGRAMHSAFRSSISSLSATRNIVTVGSVEPTNPLDDDIWVDTISSPYVTKIRKNGIWTIGGNYVVDTDELTDSANLGGTANWSEVEDDDGNLPDDNATEGAPAGTNVGSTDAATVESDAAKAGLGLNSTGYPKLVIKGTFLPDDTVAKTVGLNINQKYLGYYSGSAWLAYIDNQGNMKFGDGIIGPGIEWSQIAGTLKIRGTLNADDIGAGTIKGVRLLAGDISTGASFITSAAVAGASTLQVDDTTNFPTSGFAYFFDGGVNDRDNIFYTGKTSNSLTGVAGLLDHDNGSLIIPEHKNISICGDAGELRFYDDRGDGVYQELISLGLRTIGSDNILGKFGDNNFDGYALYASSGGTGIYAKGASEGVYSTTSGGGTAGRFVGDTGYGIYTSSDGVALRALANGNAIEAVSNSDSGSATYDVMCNGSGLIFQKPFSSTRKLPSLANSVAGMSAILTDTVGTSYDVNFDDTNWVFTHDLSTVPAATYVTP